MGENVQKHGNDDAQNDARAQRKEERDVPATVGKVSGQTAQREPGAACYEQQNSNEHDQKSSGDERSSENGHVCSRFSSFVARAKAATFYDYLRHD
jgi:hypothetical protein